METTLLRHIDVDQGHARLEEPQLVKKSPVMLLRPTCADHQSELVLYKQKHLLRCITKVHGISLPHLDEGTAYVFSKAFRRCEEPASS